MDLRQRLKTAKYPLITAALLLGFIAIYPFLGLPSNDRLIEIFGKLLSRYGYAIVFVCAFIEALPFVNLYFPGSTIVVLAVTLSQQGRLNVLAVLSAAALAFVTAHICNYALGRYGLHQVLIRYGLGSSLDNARVKLAKHGISWVWIAYVHPNIGALAAVSAGTLRLPFTRLLLHSLGAVILWVSFWGALAYFGKKWILHPLLDLKWAVAAILIWLLYKLLKPSEHNY